MKISGSQVLQSLFLGLVIAGVLFLAYLLVW